MKRSKFARSLAAALVPAVAAAGCADTSGMPSVPPPPPPGSIKPSAPAQALPEGFMKNKKGRGGPPPASNAN